jgi:rare lipoprotein A (peptidoglycan hydrolase)
MLLLVITVPILIGVFYGNRAAADEVRFEETSANPWNSTPGVGQPPDPRHPVEIHLVPLFYRGLPELSQALRLDIFDEDRLQMVPPIEYGLGGQLTIQRALPITVVDGNAQQVYRTWAETIGELLAEQRIEVGDRDRVEPAAETQTALNQTVTITRVSVVEVTKTEAIAFISKTVDNANAPRGEKQTVQRGKKGSKTLTYQVTRENGQEIGRKLIKTEVTKEPVEEIISVGTRVKVLGSGRATWYDPPWSGLTAAHNTLPKGTMVDVVNVSNGKRVTVKINDRGIQSDAVIDLSVEAFRELAPLGSGVITVRLEVAG